MRIGANWDVEMEPLDEGKIGNVNKTIEILEVPMRKRTDSDSQWISLRLQNICFQSC